MMHGHAPLPSKVSKVTTIALDSSPDRIVELPLTCRSKAQPALESPCSSKKLMTQFMTIGGAVHLSNQTRRRWVYLGALRHIHDLARYPVPLMVSPHLRPVAHTRGPQGWLCTNVHDEGQTLKLFVVVLMQNGGATYWMVHRSRVKCGVRSIFLL
jgi:hypothetical protein